MHKTLKTAFMLIGSATVAPAAVISFTGGMATYADYQIWTPTSSETVPGGTSATDSTKVFRNVDYYIEDGFIFDYIGGTGGSIGNYYSTVNDVIHGHWGSGDMTSIEIRKENGGTFDFNYFVLTSNTLEPGGASTGLENVFVQAWFNGSQVGTDVILPSSDFGFPSVDVYFGSDFDNVDKIVITSNHTSPSCFGMDSFYIDQTAPIPEPSVFSILAIGLGGSICVRRRR
jgi:hypothetical protein